MAPKVVSFLLKGNWLLLTFRFATPELSLLRGDQREGPACDRLLELSVAQSGLHNSPVNAQIA